MSDRVADREDARSLQITLEREPQAPSVARAALAGFTESSELLPEELDTLALLVSELVSNAVLHSDAPPACAILLCAQLLDRGTVRVEVIDRGSGFAVELRERGSRDGFRQREGPRGGYGLCLVDAQATRWGVDREGGTRVWFEIAKPPPS